MSGASGAFLWRHTTGCQLVRHPQKTACVLAGFAAGQDAPARDPPGRAGWLAGKDAFVSNEPNGIQRMVVFWQLSPSVRLTRLDATTFRIEMAGDRLLVVWIKMEKSSLARVDQPQISRAEIAEMRGLCSPLQKNRNRTFHSVGSTVEHGASLVTDFLRRRSE